MSEATFSQDAEADLLDIVEFIARDNPIAAREWVDAVRQRCHLLSVGLYVIFFRPSASGVEIARILHGSRDLSR